MVDTILDKDFYNNDEVSSEAYLFLQKHRRLYQIKILSCAYRQLHYLECSAIEILAIVSDLLQRFFETFDKLFELFFNLVPDISVIFVVDTMISRFMLNMQRINGI